YEKLKGLADPEFRQIYLAYDQAVDWDPADGRLEALADQILAFAARYEPGEATSPPELANDQLTLALMSPPGDLPPAWIRLDELIQERAGQRLTDPRPLEPPDRR